MNWLKKFGSLCLAVEQLVGDHSGHKHSDNAEGLKYGDRPC